MQEANINEALKVKASRNRIPLVSAFEVSPICNFACKMCYIQKTKKEADAAGGILPVEWWINLAKEAKEEGLLYPLITGGEPFLYPGIEKLAKAMHELGLLYTMNTNGSMITERSIGWLLKYPPLMLNITLYGASDETYESLCCIPKGFTRVKESIRLLQKYHIPFRFNSSITPHNQHDLKKIIDFGKSVGIPVRVATYMFPPVRRVENSYGQNDRMTPEECGKQKVMTEYYQSDPEVFAGVARYYSQFTPLSEIDFDHLELGEGEHMACLAGKSSYWVDWRGNLSACGMEDKAMADLKKISFKEGWQKVVKYADTVMCRKVCSACPNKPFCPTCISMVYNETGSFNERPEYFCRMMESAAIWYRKILAEMEEKGLVTGKQGEVVTEPAIISSECDF